MASLKMKVGLTALLGTALVATVSVRNYRRQMAENGEQQQIIKSINTISQHVLKLVAFAGNNGDRLPKSLQEIGVPELQYELLRTGSMSATLGEFSMILRERQPWKTAAGDWARAYGFADGHSEVHTQKDANFSPWEIDKEAGRQTR